MHGWGLFFFLLFLLLIFAAVGWVVFTQVRARRAGLPPPTFKSYIPFVGGGSSSSRNYPTPRQGGPIGWIKDRFASLKNSRTAQGAYEEPLEAGTMGRGRRGLDPDEAWDARVGNEADAYGPGGGQYEEQELGLAPSHEPYGGTSYGGSAALPSYGDGERGRSRSREPEAYIGGGQQGLDARYDEETGRPRSRENPFGDQHEAASLRDVSPRPVIDTSGLGPSKGKGSHDDSPTERRSMFRESL